MSSPRSCPLCWETAESFSDLVTLNLEFLNREIDHTPIHGGPLCQESDMIQDALKRLCKECDVVTLSSQPAFLQPLHRQKGYLRFVARVDHQPSMDTTHFIADKLRDEGLDCAVTVNHASWHLAMHGPVSRDVTQRRPTKYQRWKGETFNHFDDEFYDEVDDELSSYDTLHYKASRDKRLVYVLAADSEWGMDADHCVMAVRRVLMSTRLKEDSDTN